MVTKDSQKNSGTDALLAWQAAQSELVRLELTPSAAMSEYASNLIEPPRALIIEVERKREQVVRLFELAIEALDAQSLARTGHTDFGTLK